jgi:hypothetical protein
MRELALPYPLVVGRLAAGEWSSSVSDRLTFEGRAPVRVGEDVAVARAAVEAATALDYDVCPEVAASLVSADGASTVNGARERQGKA